MKAELFNKILQSVKQGTGIEDAYRNAGLNAKKFYDQITPNQQKQLRAAKKQYITENSEFRKKIDQTQDLREKLINLEIQRDNLTEAAAGGNVEAQHKRSILMYKIEVCKNRLHGAFGKAKTAALQPVPSAMNYR